MNNRKGFTLIELLAVIVILAIIMVIAVPQILNVIDSSRESSWSDSGKLISIAIETRTTLFNPTTGESKYTLNDLCVSNATNELNKIADIGDMTATCLKTTDTTTITATFTLTGIKQFNGREATIICISDLSGTSASCSETISQSSGSLPNPYETTFDGTYTYSQNNNNYKDVIEPSWKYYIRKDISTNKREICGVFPSGTICLEHSSSRSSDFGDCSGNLSYTGGSTCLTGYTKGKADEMLSKGASSCDIASNNSNLYDEVTCYNGTDNCKLMRSGVVYCKDGSHNCRIYANGNIVCY